MQTPLEVVPFRYEMFMANMDAWISSVFRCKCTRLYSQDITSLVEKLRNLKNMHCTYVICISTKEGDQTGEQLKVVSQFLIHSLVKLLGTLCSFQVYHDFDNDCLLGWVNCSSACSRRQDQMITHAVASSNGNVRFTGSGSNTHLIAQMWEWEAETALRSISREIVHIYIYLQLSDDPIYLRQLLHEFNAIYSVVTYDLHIWVVPINFDHETANNETRIMNNLHNVQTLRAYSTRDIRDHIHQKCTRNQPLRVIVTHCRIYLRKEQETMFTRTPFTSFAMQTYHDKQVGYPSAQLICVHPDQIRGYNSDSGICEDISHWLYDAFCHGVREFTPVVTYPTRPLNKDGVCVYTVVTGNYEGNIIRNRALPDCDVFVLTDDKRYGDEASQHGMLPIIIHASGTHPKTAQRMAKAQPHIYLPRMYKWSLYVDGHMQLLIQNVQSYLNTVSGFMASGCKLICYLHPTRDSILEEASVVATMKLERIENVFRMLSEMEKDNINHGDLTLTETNVLFRCHADKQVIRFHEEWAKCLLTCKRDQIFYDYLLAKYRIHANKLQCWKKPARKHRHVNPSTRHVSSTAQQSLQELHIT